MQLDDLYEQCVAILKKDGTYVGPDESPSNLRFLCYNLVTALRKLGFKEFQDDGEFR